MRPALITLLDVPWLYNPLRGLAARDPQGLMPHLDRWVHDQDLWIR